MDSPNAHIQLKSLFTGLLILTLFTAKSQVLISLLFGEKLNSPNVEFGLETGINWSNISGLESNGYAGKFNIGFYFNFRVKNQWFINTGVLVKSNLGTGGLTDNDLLLTDSEPFVLDGVKLDGRYSQILDYFIVPVLAKYRFDNNFYVAAGPQFSLMYDAFLEFDSKDKQLEARVREYNKDYFSRIDIGATGAIGYILRDGKGMTIGLKYYYGFFDVYKNVAGTKNSSFFAHVNIPIGAAKKETKPEDK